MTITELINTVREQAIVQERALREVAPLVERLALGLAATLQRATFEPWFGVHSLYLFPKPRLLKAQTVEQLNRLLPYDWLIQADTGQPWITASGQCGGYKFDLAVYTDKDER